MDQDHALFASSALLKEIDLWEANVDRWIDQTVMSFSPVKNVSMMSHFRLYQFSLKLKMFVDISCRDRKLGTYKECDEVCNSRALKAIELACPENFVAEYKCNVSQYHNVKAILDDAQEIQEHLDKVRLASREKAVIALAKALPFPREVLFVLLDKMVEVQEENPDEDEAWRIEKVSESEKLEGHGLDGQNFLDLYNAMIEIYEGLKKFRLFWTRVPRMSVSTGMKILQNIEADEDEWETEDEGDDDDDNIEADEDEWEMKDEGNDD